MTRWALAGLLALGGCAALQGGAAGLGMISDLVGLKEAVSPSSSDIKVTVLPPPDMENSNMLDYLMTNSGDLAAALVAFLGFAAAVAKVTPTKRDDSYVAKAQKVVDRLLPFVPSNGGDANKG